MTTRSEQFVEVIDLTAALCNGAATAEQIVRLEELLMPSAEARQVYRDYLALHADLAWDPGVLDKLVEIEQSRSMLLEAIEDEQQLAQQREARRYTEEQCEEEREHRYFPRATHRDEPLTPVRHIVIPRWLVYGAMAATVVIAMVGAWMERQPSPSSELVSPLPERRTEPSIAVPKVEPPVVATLSTMYAAQWEGAADTQPGMVLRRGESLALRSGFAAIQMNRGATLVMEGPCRLVLRDDNTVLLERGKLVAHVPGEARRFTVHAPYARIIDLGTEFGVQVLNDGTSHIHVFEGLVELTATNDTTVSVPIQLAADQSASARHASIERTDGMPPVQFMRWTQEAFGDSTAFEGASVTDAWVLAGDASLLDDGVSLTPAAEWYGGMVSTRRPLRFAGDMSFNAHFVVRLSDPGISPEGTKPSIGKGGDGMAFVLHTNGGNLEAPGVLGHLLGIDHLSPAFSLVLDTWSVIDGRLWEPEGDYVAIRLNGKEDNHVIQRTPFALNDGQPIHIWLNYDAQQRFLQVYMDHSARQPSTPLLTAAIDVHQALGMPDSVYVTMAGATGNAWQKHEVLALSMRTFVKHAEALPRYDQP